MEGIWRLSETRVGIELLGQLNNKNDKYKKDKKTNTKTNTKTDTHINTEKYQIHNPNAKSQMFRLRPPTFGGQSLSSEKLISRLPEVRFKV